MVALPKEAPLPTRQQAEQFETDGYFIADDAVEPGMFDELAAAARRVKHQVRSGQVDVYTHWSTEENTEPWAIRGLLAPEFDEPVFAEYLTSKPVMDYVHAFIGDDLDPGLHPDLHQSPSRRLLDRLAPRLGRDGARPRPRRRDGGAGQAAHHLALAPRHRRRREPATRARQPPPLPDPGERRCLLETRHADIAGQHSIRLKAGQAVFWSGDTIHRGLNRRDTERLTVSAGWSVHEPDAEPQPVDGRLRWRLRDDVRSNLPAALLPYFDRWRVLQLA